MVKKALLFIVLGVLLIASLALPGCKTETTPAATTSIATTSIASTSAATTSKTVTAKPTTLTTTTVTTPAANIWSAKLGEPQYGGELIFRSTSLAAVFDPPMPGASHFWCEHLFKHDWALDRNTWGYNTAWAPSEYFVGHLVESWEWPDSQTMIAHIRKGVYWQDKPPANGRELVANDIKQHYDRAMGVGGYSAPSPMTAQTLRPIKEVTVSDDHTLVFKFKDPSLFINQLTIVDIAAGNIIECPEMVKANTGNDWKSACGTGAYMLTDFVQDTSLTMSRNPKYWGYDERFPKNKLPYADIVKLLNIPDVSTALAALRTGKIDWLTDINILQSNSLKQTNPDIVQKSKPNPGWTIDCRCDTKPFTDMNVRKALQLAIDNKTIASTLYKGLVDGKPVGIIPKEHKGWGFMYDRWPKDLQDEYSYNPTMAKELLAQAGYPNGFKTHILASSIMDMDLLQIVKAEFLDIGLDMEIKVESQPTFMAITGDLKHDQLVMGNWSAKTHPPQVAVQGLTSTQRGNVSLNNDPVYDAMYTELLKATSTDEAKKVVLKADEYVLRHHWGAVTCPSVVFIAVQPYFKGFSGEDFAWAHTREWVFPRLWVDQNLKKTMGR